MKKNIADRYCHELVFKMAGKEKQYRAIGFKNNAAGYELRNEYFKGSSSPKYVSYLDNKADTIKVFEGFFHLLSFQSMHQNEQMIRHLLVLNSLSFFKRSLLLMEKYQSIHLYLDNDEAGRKCTTLAQKRSIKFNDESKLYAGYRDLNEWSMKCSRDQKLKEVQHRMS